MFLRGIKEGRWSPRLSKHAGTGELSDRTPRTKSAGTFVADLIYSPPGRVSMWVRVSCFMFPITKRPGFKNAMGIHLQAQR